MTSQLTREKEERDWFEKWEREIATDHMGNNKLIKEYYEKLYAQEADKLEKNRALPWKTQSVTAYTRRNNMNKHKSLKEN